MDHLESSQTRETQRLATLARYRLLDTPPESAFDRITKLAARRLRTPIASISLVDRDRIWFKSTHGLDVQQLKRHPSPDDAALLPRELCWISDTSQEASFQCFGELESQENLRFYAAAPLVTYDGHVLGTLSVMDRRPRAMDPRLQQELTELAESLMKQIESRRLFHRLERHKSAVRAQQKRNRARRAQRPHAQAQQPEQSQPQSPRLSADRLTALPDRSAFMQRLAQHRTRAAALLLVDLDHFQAFNARHGFAAGDRLLCAVARRLEGLRGPRDTVARLGADTFGLLLEDLNRADDGRLRARAVLDELHRPLDLDGDQVEVTVRAGLSIVAPGESQTIDTPMVEAEASLREARSEYVDGAEAVKTTTQTSPTRLEQTVELYGEVVDNGEDAIHVVCEPALDPEGRLEGFDARLRLNLRINASRRPTHGMPKPAPWQPAHTPSSGDPSVTLESSMSGLWAT